MANQRRVYQIAEKIRNVVATEILHAADPRLSLVTITSTIVSPDLRQAKLYWVCSGGKERVEEVAEALDKASGMLRRVIGKELSIKFVPEIRFYYDDTLDAVEEVDRLFKRIHQEDADRAPSEKVESQESEK